MDPVAAVVALVTAVATAVVPPAVPAEPKREPPPVSAPASPQPEVSPQPEQPSGPPPRGSKPARQRPRFADGEMLVRFEPSSSQADRAGARARHNLEKIRALPLPGLELVRARDRANIPDKAKEVRAEPSVRYAEPNFIFQPSKLPDDPQFPQQWGLNNTGQTIGPAGATSTGTLDADIDAPEAWEVTSGGQNQLIGVLDTGIKITHPDLAPNIWTNPGESGAKAGNGIDDDGNGYIDDVNGWDFFHNDKTVFDEADGDDHGTHVAGVIAASWNDTGIAGISPAKILPLKFIGREGGSTADAILALDYAIAKGALLTNNSWGGPDFSQALQDKIAQAGAAGQLFIAAAGNGNVLGAGDDNDLLPFYPASYDNPNIISVAATDNKDQLATFSNFGATSVDMGAPGVGIASTVPGLPKAVLTDASVAYKSALHTFGLEGVTDAAAGRALLSAGLSWMGVAKTDPILVVDDDEGENFETSYTGALTALGYTTVTTHTVPTLGLCATMSGPGASAMSTYKAVIWFTGHAFSCTLNDADQAALTTHLDSNRNLMLFGQDIGYDLTQDGTVDNAFLSGKLRTGYIADADFNFALRGVSGRPYASVPALPLNPAETDGGQYYSSAVTALPGATAGLRGGDYTWLSGTSMAAPSVAASAAQVHASYPAAGHLDVKNRLLNGGDANATLSGETVSGRRLNLAGALDTAGAPVLSGVSVSPSPFSPNGDGIADTTTLMWTQNEPAKVTVTVTPQGGTTPVRTVSLGPRPAGANSWAWDGKNNASGLATQGIYNILVSATDVVVATSAGGVSVVLGPVAALRFPPDFNGDQSSEVAVYRASDGMWYPKDLPGVQWGASGDEPVPADYNGDAKTDVAVFRPSNGVWFVKDQFAVQWGASGDKPVPADYNGDGLAEPAVYRTGVWFIRGGPTVQWGTTGDIPVPADYDGDGDTDIAVYRPSNGVWFVKDQAGGQWGGDPSDKPVPTDYDGDGKADLAVYRAASGIWYIKNQQGAQWGAPTDTPVPADYNGDRKADIAVYRPSGGFWFVRNGATLQWGGDPSDIPLSAGG